MDCLLLKVVSKETCETPGRGEDPHQILQQLMFQDNNNKCFRNKIKGYGNENHVILSLHLTSFIQYPCKAHKWIIDSLSHHGPENKLLMSLKILITITQLVI